MSYIYKWNERWFQLHCSLSSKANFRITGKLCHFINAFFVVVVEFVDVVHWNTFGFQMRHVNVHASNDWIKITCTVFMVSHSASNTVIIAVNSTETVYAMSESCIQVHFAIQNSSNTFGLRKNQQQQRNCMWFLFFLVRRVIAFPLFLIHYFPFLAIHL